MTGTERGAARSAVARSGIQSVQVAMRLLKTMATFGAPVTLNRLSEAVGMKPAKTHRYLASLVESGFVAKLAHGKYDLGPYVLEFATSYLARLDPTAIAGEMIERLSADTGEGIVLSVWGDAGTTVIRWHQARRPISIGIRPGTVFPATMSAAGRVFLAYLPAETTAAAVAQELETYARERHPLAPRDRREVDAIVDETRRHGLARVTGHAVDYLSALAAPIFNYRGEAVLALSLFGFRTAFDVAWDGRNAALLRRTASDISHRLGYVPDVD